MHEARATDAVDHLQGAALELIEAARAFLDVLEEVVADRDRLGEAVDVVGAAATAAARLVGMGATAGSPDAPAPAPHPDAEHASRPVERIPVS